MSKHLRRKNQSMTKGETTLKAISDTSASLNKKGPMGNDGSKAGAARPEPQCDMSEEEMR